MNLITKQLIELAQNTRYERLGAETVHECKRRIIDSIACAMASFNHPLSISMRTLASSYRGAPDAALWGTGVRTTPEMAAFANGVMVRVGENSDTFIGKGGGGHPSDMIAGLIAVAEAAQASGQALIEAIVIAYDVYCGLMDAVDLAAKGWDQAFHVTLGTVLGASRLLGLDESQMEQAISLAICPNMALRQTRHGELSHWKGCAGANAARNAVFAATLAQRGVIGPSGIFDGKQGLWSVTGQFEWPVLYHGDSLRMVARTSIKPLPVCYHTQSAALAALKLFPKLAKDTISQVHVHTYRTALEMAADGAHQWAPQTSESADHSLPFVVATALLHGAIAPSSFQADRLACPDVRKVMSTIQVSEDPALSSLWPKSAAARVTVETRNGVQLSEEILYPKGHVNNPMSDDEVATKLYEGVSALAGQDKGKKIVTTLWGIDQNGVLASAIGQVLAQTFG
ncbi:MmgE/PrpD family protein [Advenella mimigardefordensis]|uniref:Putative 2-methylcitrate dehydratase PrpD n=1 Tax=Advenella mimigardefordensis (strain DSM 17166 / LMG 22922 / DPN7) TaxID=1247726 RepID=W0PB65_ADVMD|nr:MmgE/PrpD family protein [Advenella mimigardefordensis]AHG64109.1 putative 2-methylcitrate dehydratase PrpD [Advenella mimigardefordensis DPN7]